jgi:hypothetical protein
MNAYSSLFEYLFLSAYIFEDSAQGLLEHNQLMNLAYAFGVSVRAVSHRPLLRTLAFSRRGCLGMPALCVISNRCLSFGMPALPAPVLQDARRPA